MATLRRLLLATALAVVIAPTLQVLHPGTADAAAYRYWGFARWSDGAWSFASKGPDATTPKDGSVDGWRYAVAGKKTPPRLPRAAGNFDRICASTPAEAGHKRVAVVLDYGLASEAPDGAEPPKPRGACAVVDTDATSAEVLAAVAKTRLHKGMVCGLDGYPSSGCSEPVDQAPTVASPEPTVALALPGDGAQQAATATPDADRSGQKADDQAANQGDQQAEQADQADQQDDGSAGWQIAVLVLIVALLAGGAILRRRRAADR